MSIAGRIMTTTVIYKLTISDDAKGRRFCRQPRQYRRSDRYRNPKTGLNITDFTDCNAIGWTASLPEANGKERNNVRSAQDIMGSR
jgi:hypothetical protein